ncbi:DnaD domain-containing protein [Alicyclobacillus contaminans]|uniref:DnaD domain-containing protein n=1 Tax=Alicyclobacillus contaminans TaxID=392016 RepID=UPI0012EC3F62|nr:DnaD domain protein [Alicyclobacillus contaminans]
MARKVFVSSDMSQDERLIDVAEHDPQAALLWPWLLTAFDDWGRARASAKRLKATVFPMIETVTAETIESALQQYAHVGLIVLYEVDGVQYMAIPEDKWYKYQTHMKRSNRRPGKDKMQSDYPAPPEFSTDPHGDSRGNSGDNGAPQFPVPSPSPTPSPLERQQRDGMIQGALKELTGSTTPLAVDSKPSSSLSSSDNALAKAAKAYEAEIGVLSSMVQEELTALVDEFPVDWIEDAIREAALQNVRKLSYVRSILSNWQTEGRGALPRGQPARSAPISRARIGTRYGRRGKSDRSNEVLYSSEELGF